MAYPRPCRFLLLYPLALVSLSGLLLGSAVAASADPPAITPALIADPAVATTHSGRIRGDVDQGIHAFKGIPYGDDTANFRFQPPRPPKPWLDVRDALHFGPMAPQPGGRGDSDLFPTPPADAKMSEDCLNLNVWTPALHDGQKRP